MDEETIKKRLISDIEKLRDPKGFIRAGFPRFNTLYGRDSLIASWQLLDYDAAIAKNTLKILAELQGQKIDPLHEEEPGKILHETRWGQPSEGAWPIPYYASVDATPLFVILAGKYFKKTKDKDFIQSILPNIKKAKDWILTHGDENKDGFLDYRRKNPKGFFHHGWKDTDFCKTWQPPIAIVEAQGYKYEALCYFQKLTGEETESLANFKEKFLNSFFWPEEKFFYLAIDAKGVKYQIPASNPGHLLFTNLIEMPYKKLIVQRLFQNDFWTDYGIRTHSTANVDFNPYSYHLGSIWPFDNWMIAQGLKISGFEKEYEMVRQALLKTYRVFGYLPELYCVNLDGEIRGLGRANPLQAWSSAGLLNMLQ